MLKLAIVVFLFVSPALAKEHENPGKGDGSGGSRGEYGAPGPLVGAGLPVLAIGYGVYWLVRRRLKRPS